MAFSMFHFSEFLAVALTNPKTLTVDSFILNHSVQYWVAAVSSWVEAGVENYFFPGKNLFVGFKLERFIQIQNDHFAHIPISQHRHLETSNEFKGNALKSHTRA